MPGTKGGLWTYRRLLDAHSSFGGAVAARPDDVQLAGQRLPRPQHHRLPAAEVAAALQDAKRVSLGFLHWLQTEAPADGDARGAPELRLRPDVMGTADGLSKHPYIRESRRILALTTVVEQDVSAHFQPGPRAAHFADSVGVGWYPIDIHRAGPDDVGVELPHAAVPDPARRAAAGARDEPARRRPRTSARRTSPTAATGCIRSSGTSARRPARWPRSPCSTATTPAAVRRNLLAPFQRSLLAEGVPLAWIVDVGVGSSLLQRRAIVVHGGSARHRPAVRP